MGNNNRWNDIKEALEMAGVPANEFSICVEEGQVVLKPAPRWIRAKRRWQDLTKNMIILEMHAIAGVTVFIGYRQADPSRMYSGTANCNPEDRFDPDVGRAIAVERALFGRIVSNWLIEE